MPNLVMSKTLFKIPGLDPDADDLQNVTSSSLSISLSVVKF